MRVLVRVLPELVGKWAPDQIWLRVSNLSATSGEKRRHHFLSAVSVISERVSCSHGTQNWVKVPETWNDAEDFLG